MQKYKDINHDSNVDFYEAGSGYIRVKFKDGGTYLYTDFATGAANIAQMKVLAANGNGLNSFINKVVKKKYARREV